MTHPNEDLVRSAYAAFSRGDLEAVLQRFDDAISWHVGGDSKITGEYRGHQQVLGFFGSLMEFSGGTFHLDLHDVLANDEHAVALVTLTASSGQRTVEGLPGAHVWHVRAGKLTAFWDCPSDQVVIDDLFRP